MVIVVLRDAFMTSIIFLTPYYKTDYKHTILFNAKTGHLILQLLINLSKAAFYRGIIAG